MVSCFLYAAALASLCPTSDMTFHSSQQRACNGRIFTAKVKAIKGTLISIRSHGKTMFTPSDRILSEQGRGNFPRAFLSSFLYLLLKQSSVFARPATDWVPQAGQFQQGKFIFSQFSNQKSEIKVSSRLVSAKVSLHGLQMAIFSPCKSTAFPACVSVF